LIPLAFLDDLMRLKRIPRSGWITYRISRHDLESVSSHSYSVAVIALVISETLRTRNQNVDVEEVLRMALLHDLSESLTFDISKAYLRYLGRTGSKVKARIERRAVSHLLSGLQNGKLSRKFGRSLEEYSAAKSLEPRIVHAADALDLLLQILEYQRMGYRKTALDPIWRETKSKLKHCDLEIADNWMRRLERVRRELDITPTRKR
jgi:5'-deoxynucleotidase YfbR-like HD superfamily hydrolase